MTKTTLRIALAAAAIGALGTLAALAGGADKATSEHHKIKLVTGDAGKIDLDLESMAVGDSRPFTTDSGKAGTVTRTAKGYDLDLDGKTIKVDLDLDLDADGAMHLRLGGKDVDGEAREVIVRGGKAAAGAGRGERNIVIVTSGDEDGEPGTKTITKRVVIRGDGEVGGDGVQVRVLDGDAADAMVEGLGDGDAQVIVIRKKAGDGDPQERKIEIRVEDDGEHHHEHHNGGR